MRRMTRSPSAAMTSFTRAGSESLAAKIRPPPANTRQNVRVLVVEDEPEVAGSLSRGLAEAGMSVDIALSGEEAVDAIRASLPYDVAVLDVMLGGGLGRH